MNSYKSILSMERCRTMSYAQVFEPEKAEPCPICNGTGWDYLLKDKDGSFVGCDDCTKRIYS